MGIILIVAGLVLPSMRGPMDAINLSGASSAADATLALARQTAVSRNLPVEVRLYKYDDGTGSAYRVIGAVITAAASTQAADEWVSPPKALPGNILLIEDPKFSTLLARAVPYVSPAPIAPWKKTDATGPSLVRNKEYISFTFQPNGSTNLAVPDPNGSPIDGWCLTLKNPHSPAVGTAPAANYVAIVIDALTGRTLIYQP